MARRCAAVAAIGAAVCAVVVAGSGRAEAAQCASMTVQYGDFPPDIELAPARVSIGYGGCVTFTNQTATTATITVGKGYTVNLEFGESTTGKTNFVGSTSGPQQVSATSGPATATGSITVGPSPTPTPSPTATQQSSSAAAPPPPPSRSGRATTTGPQVAPKPKHAKPPPVPSLHPLPSATAVVPPLAPTPQVATPGSSPASRTRVVAGRLEPPTGRALGLPASLAALAVAGTAAALVRVLLAEPIAAVDNTGTVGRTA